MYVLACPCILDPGLRAKGITSSSDIKAFGRAVERCMKFGVEIVPLPCPETLYLGRDRDPGGFSGRLDTPEFHLLLDTAEARVKQIISSRGCPVAIIGVDSSPTCGVNETYHGTKEEGKRKGPGVFLQRFEGIPVIDVKDFARYRVYLAAPLFSEAEKAYNLAILALLRACLYDVYLPQEVGDNTHCRDAEAHEMIFLQHISALREIDVVVAVIDGADADSGTAWEMGFACALGKPVIALRTDFRMVGECERVNLMLERSATKVVSKKEDLPAALGSPFVGTAPHP